jgi:hypothetical protein
MRRSFLAISNGLILLSVSIAAQDRGDAVQAGTATQDSGDSSHVGGTVQNAIAADTLGSSPDSLAVGTGPKLLISGNFRGHTFNEFSAEAEKQLGLRFIFMDAWVSSIQMTASGDDLVLEEVLRQDLRGAGLYFHLDAHGRVLITPAPLITSLPEYEHENGIPGEEVPHSGDDILTQAEEQYMHGRREADVGTIVIGRPTEYHGERAAVITGEIKDEESGEPLIGVTIYIEELEKGFVTNHLGRFTLSIPTGSYTARFNCLGMEEQVYELEVHSGGQMNIDMAKKLYAIDEITVRAGEYDHVRGVQMGFTQLSIKSIKEIPVVMGEKDVIRVVNMLPGVQNAGEGSAGLYVRGSAADQNMFIINRIPVYNTSHLFGFFSAFNPDIIRDFSFYKSNLPVKYGGKLASVIDISTRQGNNKRYTARGGISPVTAHVAVEGPILRERTSLVLSARSTYSDWILSRMEDPDLRNSNAFFYDLAGGINHKHNDNNLIKLFGYYSHDNFALASTNRYEYSNAGASLVWWHQYSTKLDSETSLAFSRYRFDHEDITIPLEAYQHDYRIDHLELKYDFNWLTAYRHNISFGGNAIYYNLDRGEILPFGEESDREYVYLGKERGVEGALYISDQIPITSKFTLQGGLRYSLYAYLGPQTVYEYAPGSPIDPEYVTGSRDYGNGEVVRFYSGPEIRASAIHLLGENRSLKASYNKTRQYLYMLSNTFAISPTDQWKLCDYYIRPAAADQVSLGYYQDLARKSIKLSAEIYYKMIRNIVEYRDGADFISSPNIETEVMQGDQEAYGIELLLKRDAGKLTGWLSFAWSKSLMLVNGEYEWEEINNGKVYPANYDIPVSVNTVLNYRVNRRISFSSNLVYHTGRPVTYPISVFRIDGKRYVHYSDRNEYRIPDYFRIDLSVNVEGNLREKKLAHSYWMLNIYNLTGRRNAYSVYFNIEGNRIKGYRLSIFGQPIVTLSWNSKFGNYASA